MSLAVDLEIEFKEAAQYTPSRVRGAVAATVPATAVQIWATSITGIIKLAVDKALELGRAYRTEIECAAKLAIDAVVALDLPWIPPSVEGVIDEVTKAAGYRAVEAVLDAVLGTAS